MNESLSIHRARLGVSADTALDASVRFWFVVTALGQLMFAAYVATKYGPLLLLEGLEGLKKAPLFNGFIPGDMIGNPAVAAHILLAIVIMGGGPLQLTPPIRTQLPRFHRWLGRAYVLGAILTSTLALYLIWSRPLFGAPINNIGNSAGGVLTIAFAIVAWRYAMARDFHNHERWALRLFMTASAVWYLRIGTQVWVYFTGGLGIDSETWSGPFLAVWHFGQYLLPLAVLEWYFRVRCSTRSRGRFAFAVGLATLTVLMVIGTSLVVSKNL